MVTQERQEAGPNPYRARFHDLLAATLAHLHMVITAEGFVITDAFRAQILHNLSYALEIETLWPTVRQMLIAVLPYIRRDLLRNEWVPYLDAALDQSIQGQDHSSATILACQLGALFQWQNSYPEAHAYLQRSATFAQRANDPVAQAQALNRAAYVAYLQHDIVRATELVTEAIRLLPSDHPDCEFTYFVQGMIAKAHHETDKAIVLFRQSLALVEQSNQLHRIGMRMNALGTALSDAKQYETAIDIYQQAINAFIATGDSIECAVTYMNLGNIYLWLNQPANSLHYYELAEVPLRLISDMRTLAQLEHNRGLAFRELQEWRAAQEQLQSAIQRWQQLANPYLLANSLDDLGLVYHDMGDFARARHSWQQALDCLQLVDDRTYSQLQQSIQKNLSTINHHHHH